VVPGERVDASERLNHFSDEHTCMALLQIAPGHAGSLKGRYYPQTRAVPTMPGNWARYSPACRPVPGVFLCAR